MKKTAIILVFAMLLTFVLAACNDTTVPQNSGSEPESSAPESAAPSEDKSEEPSKEVSEPSEEESELPPEEFTYSTAVSLGKKYTSSVAAGDAYPDTYGAELTDGLFAPKTETSYSEEKFAGYAPGTLSTLSVVVDLGEKLDRLYEFRADYLCTNGAGIMPPTMIVVSVSDDGDTWTKLGRTKNPAFVEATAQTGVLTLERSVSARYVKFTLTKGAAWIFLDELTVISDVKGEDTDLKWIESINALYAAETLGSADRAAALAAIAGSAPDRSYYRSNISKAAKYTINGTIEDRHKDNGGTMLTDGKVSKYFEGETWVGFQGPEADITVTLGSKHTDISAFEVYAYNNQATGIAFPYRVTVLVSSDNKTWTEVGRVYAPTNSNREVFTYVLELEKEITAKYVKFCFTGEEGMEILIEEVSVIAYTEERPRDLLYPIVTVPEITGNQYWPSSESDYADTINLVKGLGQQIANGATVEETAWKNNDPVTTKLLTDGKYSAANSIYSGAFCKFNGGSSRDLIFDLTKLSAITEIQAGFTHYPDWAVYCPATVSVFLSADGVKWYSAGNISYDTTKPGVLRSKLVLDKPVEARFVCLSFAVAPWAGCDEVEIFGTKKIVSGTVKLENSGFTEKQEFMVGDYQAPSEDILGGVEDLVLIYHSTSGYLKDRDVDDLMPLVAYLDENGNIKDTMFDGFLFLMSGSLPSGNAGHAGSTASDDIWLNQTLFRDDYNIGALEKAAEKLKTALNLASDYKLKFYVTIYYPEKGSKFGDIDGDGQDDILDSLEMRVKACEYYINLFEEELAKHDYKNIEFAGYYWYDESMDDSDGDLELLTAVKKKVENRGRQLFWIPYYQASGYNLWAEHGFDIACMQPNYAFGLDRSLSNIETTALLCKRFGMGIEIEIDGRALQNQLYLDHYMEYLKGGVYYGYMNDCVHMYYMGGNDYGNASESKLPKIRLIYDYTYQFIKGTLDIYPDALADLSFSGEADTAVSGSVNTDGNVVRTFNVCVSPAHGTVTFNTDGSFNYYPDKGFTGTDSFTYTYNEMLDESAPCNVTVTVG